MRLRIKEIEGKFYIQRFTYHEWKCIKCYDTEKEAEDCKNWLLKDKSHNIIGEIKKKKFHPSASKIFLKNCISLQNW